MRVLITGGNGFLGTNLVPALCARGDTVGIIDSAAPRAELPDDAIWHPGDLLDAEGLARIYREVMPELVFHLAARTDLHGQSVLDYSANTTGTQNLIRVISDAGNRPFVVYASSRLVFAIDHKPEHEFDYKPSTPYGESKVLMEEIVLSDASQAGEWAMVRPTSLWGPWFGIPYRNFFDVVRSGRYFNVAGRSPSKSYGYVGNAVHELLRISDAPRGSVHGRVFWLSDFAPLVLREWANLIADAFSVRRPRTMPYWALRVAASLGDVAKRLGYPEPPITSFRLRNLLAPMVYDISETEAVVGDLPFSLKDGVENTVTWMLDRGRSTSSKSGAKIVRDQP